MEWLKFITGDQVRGTEEETEAFFKQIVYKKAPKFLPENCMYVFYRNENICTINKIGLGWSIYPYQNTYKTQEQAVLVKIELNYRDKGGKYEKINGERSANWCRAHPEAIDQIFRYLNLERRNYEEQGIVFENDIQLACEVVRSEYDRLKNALNVDPFVLEQYQQFLNSYDSIGDLKNRNESLTSFL